MVERLDWKSFYVVKDLSGIIARVVVDEVRLKKSL